MLEGTRFCEVLGRETDRGEENFNFTINFNGPHLCAYFPTGFNTKELGGSCTIGVEYPDLLAHLLEGMAGIAFHPGFVAFPSMVVHL